MIYKILSRNYLLKHYLTKGLALGLGIRLRLGIGLWLGFAIGFAAICFFYPVTNSSPGSLAATANIINGSTPEDIDEQSCSEAELLDYVENAKKYIESKWQPVRGFED